MIDFEKELLDYLGLPSVPKKAFDGNTPFEKGVAVVESIYNNREMYAVCAFCPDKGHTSPVVTKTFSVEPFKEIKEIYVVPNYMVTQSDIDAMDLDEESKQKVDEILGEANEMENDGVKKSNSVEPIDELPEWIFPEITNKQQAEAWLRKYNTSNKIKGAIPKKAETIKLRLYAIYTDINKKCE